MKKAWVAPYGERFLIPNDDSQGLMNSTFQSHEFDFSLEINESDLKKVNELHGKHTMMSQQQK